MGTLAPMVAPPTSTTCVVSPPEQAVLGVPPLSELTTVSHSDPPTRQAYPDSVTLSHPLPEASQRPPDQPAHPPPGVEVEVSPRSTRKATAEVHSRPTTSLPISEPQRNPRSSPQASHPAVTGPTVQLVPAAPHP